MKEKISHADQYKMLREEISQRQQQIYKVESSGLLGTGAIYTWLITHKTEVASALAWYIPPFILLLCFLHCIEHVSHINRIAKYLRRIEKSSFSEHANLPGWEQHVHQLSIRRYAIFFNVLAGSIWIIVLVTATVASWFLSK